jgi:hypothetical protein
MVDITKILERKQKLLHDKFKEVCRNGDLQTVIDVYNKYYVQPKQFKNKIKNKFFSFLKISQPLIPAPILDLDEIGLSVLESATFNQDGNIINFLLNDKYFLKHLNKDELYKTSALSTILSSAISDNNVKLTKLILPLIKNKNDFFYESISSGFVDACYRGHLDVITCLFNDGEVINQKLEIYETDSNSDNSYSFINKGFNIGCNCGHIELVKFFTNKNQLKKAIDINNYKGTYVCSLDVLKLLIMDLNIDKQHYLNNFKFMPDDLNAEDAKQQVLALFEQRELHKELSTDLEVNSEPAKKRLKL